MVTSLIVASGAIAIAIAAGHAWRGETRIIGPLLSAPAAAGSVLDRPAYRRVVRGVWHLPALCWALVAAATILATLAGADEPWLLWLAVVVYLVSGTTNLLGFRSWHIGWVALYAAAATLVTALVA